MPSPFAYITTVIGAALVASCFYKPGSYDGIGVAPFAGKRVALPCLDLAVTRLAMELVRIDPLDARTAEVLAKGTVIAFSFGNRCFHETHVDLAAVRAVGFGGGSLVMHAYDPKHELRPMQLDALWMGREEIEYIAEDGSIPKSVCVDVGGVEVAAVTAPHWICVGAGDLGDFDLEKLIGSAR